MLALSIMQPWAWAIIHAGKTVENRSWPTLYPAMSKARALVTAAREGWEGRGEFLIHAGKGVDSDYENDVDFIRRVTSGHAHAPCRQDVHRGGIVGRARLVDIVRTMDSPWFFGPTGLILADVQPLPFFPCKGALGFFSVDYPTGT